MKQYKKIFSIIESKKSLGEISKKCMTQMRKRKSYQNDKYSYKQYGILSIKKRIPNKLKVKYSEAKQTSAEVFLYDIA